jgi:DNA repair exonuclease SbcCD ATPase subunit
MLERIKELDKEDIEHIEEIEEHIRNAEAALKDAYKHEEKLGKLENAKEEEREQSAINDLKSELTKETKTIEEDIEEARLQIGKIHTGIQNLRRDEDKKLNLEKKVSELEDKLEEREEELENYVERIEKQLGHQLNTAV